MTCRRILAALVGGGILVAVMLVAGGYNVSAAAGHLPLVSSLLHFTMQNSVALRSRGPVPADLQSDARVMAGAGHYDLVCRDCHGAPGIERNAVARSLVPPPPHIVEAAKDWAPRELFWIVKHGIKMTAMPAWPSQHRDDEVWSVVAFLRRLPDMDASAYERAVAGALADQAPRPMSSDLDTHLARCARCHGYDGRGIEAAEFPRIDGLTATYLHKALIAFASGERASGIMQAQASMVPERLLSDLAEHYASSGIGSSGSGPGNAAQPPAVTGAPRVAPAMPARSAGTELDATDHGERVARRGVPSRLVPPCASCHGPVEHARAEAFPALAGQPAAYLETQLRLFRDGQRGGSEFATLMRHAARGLDDDDITAVARYYAALEKQP